VGRGRLEPGAHQKARDNEKAADEGGARADSVFKAERLKGVVEHDRVYDSPEGRARRNDGHGQCMSFLKIMRDHGDTWDIHGPRTETQAETLREKYLLRLVSADAR
jgi:hypothetical protein